MHRRYILTIGYWIHNTDGDRVEIKKTGVLVTEDLGAWWLDRRFMGKLNIPVDANHIHLIYCYEIPR